MQLGVFAKTFVRPAVEEVFAAVASHGLRQTQFNLSCLGGPSLPDAIDLETTDRVRGAASAHDVGIAAISGTANLIHPNRQQRQADLRRLTVLAESCAAIGTWIVTLSTGTRDRMDTWRRHPDNQTPEAWRDLVQALERLLTLTDATGVTFAFEPERENVVNSAARARDLLREIASPRLGVLIDPANLVDPGEAARLPDIVREAFSLIGERIVLAHAKDRTDDGSIVAAGEGVVPWPLYVDLLSDAGYTGPLILHGLAEDEVSSAVAFLRDALPAAPHDPPRTAI